jgi:beta-mannosidase
MARDHISTLDLNAGWQLRQGTLGCGPERHARVQEQKTGWLPADVPCDVRQPLIAAGLISEPLDGDNSYASEWVEQRSWWFKKQFAVDDAFLGGAACELVLDGLDATAHIFLNGEPLGEHRSVFYPFVADVKRLLQPGQNLLLVRLTHGLERVSDAELGSMKPFVSTERGGGRGDRGDERRPLVRKPQYAYGWDWGPRVGTCGITGGVSLASLPALIVRDVHAVTEEIGAERARLTVLAEVESLLPCQTMEGRVRVELFDGDTVVAYSSEDRLARSGYNHFRFELAVPKPRLWWPNGMGEQHLYHLRAVIESEGMRAESATKEIGIRTLRLDQSRCGDGIHAFRFLVNGVPLFARGANWIPADSLYARVNDEKYCALIAEAREANFTMLRVWGGGIYEREAFYRECDRAGILVWQDFMFACSVYPEDDTRFLHDVEREIAWQVRRLRTHPCLALLCGNNEIQWIYTSMVEPKPDPILGLLYWNRIAPAICNLLAPEIPYWNSSPYGGPEPNANTAGDRHHWWDCTMNPEMNKRITPEEYDKVEARFVSEYGYIGPCGRSTIERYFGGSPIERGSRVWQLHNNTFEKETVPEGIRRHYTDPEGLDLDAYLLYGGLVQGLMLGYSLESLRFKAACSGALFWMYSDCWGEVGWTIIDYYLQRKPSFYFVKRALAPLRLILRQHGGLVRVVGANETPEPRELVVEYGYVSFDGSRRDSREGRVQLSAFSRGVVLEFEKAGHDEREGVYFLRPLEKDCGALPALLRSGPFRELSLPEPEVAVENIRRDGERAVLTVCSPVFAHAVHFEVPGEPKYSDNYFDLLPGESRDVTVAGLAAGLRPQDLRVRAVTV